MTEYKRFPSNSSQTWRRKLLGACAAVPLLPSLARAAPPDGELSGDILVGQSAPLSGLMAGVAAPNREGEAAAIEDVNRQGVINGRKIKIIQLDDAFDGKRALENTKQLVEKDHVVALWSYTGTSAVGAVLPYIEGQKVPLITCFSGSPVLRVKNNPYFFTATASYVDELEAMVRTMVTVQAKRIAIVYQDNPFGKLLLPAAQKTAEEQGATVVDTQALQVEGNNAADVVKALAEKKPAAVVLIAAGPAVGAYAKANRSLPGVWLCVMSLGAANSTLKALGDDARGMAAARTMPYPGGQSLPLLRDFHASMQRRGLPADYDHLNGYFYARVLIEALRQTGPRVTSATIVQAMERATTLDVGGFALHYGPGAHHGTKFVELTVVGAEGRILR